MFNRLAYIVPALYMLVWPPYGASAAELIVDFEQGHLDSEIWNDCQISGPAPQFNELVDPDETIRRVIRIVVDPTTGNSNDTCSASATRSALEQEVVDGMEPLGPSLVPASPLEKLHTAECPTGTNDDIQRNELRLQRRPELVHYQNEAHWYSLTFHVDGNIPSCGSARWILAQWKQEKQGLSPFLAQRFDNGVLHITTQNDHCRCAIASAEGDFEAAFLANTAAMPSSQQLRKSKPITCVVSDGSVRALCRPIGLEIFTVGGGAPPPLPDPKRAWVTLTYFVRGGADGNGQVDVDVLP